MIQGGERKKRENREARVAGEKREVGCLNETVIRSDQLG